MKGWGFFRASGHVPSSAELIRLRTQTGWEKMSLDAQDRAVRFSVAELELDPGGIGKGFAVDAAVALLRSRGVKAALISAGSSTIYAIGAPPGEEGWRVDIPDPRVPERETTLPLATVFLRDLSISSASCTEKHFTLAGREYCHIMNPKTLQPVREMLSVSVTDSSATASDALSNVLFVKGEQSGTEFMKTLPKDSAILVSGEVDATPRPAHCTAVHWDKAWGTSGGKNMAGKMPSVAQWCNTVR